MKRDNVVSIQETAIDFLVDKQAPAYARRPVIGLDGPVRGADFSYGHHSTGEAVNLLAIPKSVARPGTIITTQLDTDAIVSAAVVLLRAEGLETLIASVWNPLYEACHYCDHLIPSGKFDRQTECAGLGLHCWLKQEGLELLVQGKLLAAPASGSGERANSDRPILKGAVYRRLAFDLIWAIKQGQLPHDLTYLTRLAAMERAVRQSVQIVQRLVTVVCPDRYIDPLAIYRAIDTDILVIMKALQPGKFSYALGVHPRAYSRIDLRRLYPQLNAIEPGWGGRGNAGGSPLDQDSRICLGDLLEILHNTYPADSQVTAQRIEA